jgi:hypothetical protein
MLKQKFVTYEGEDVVVLYEDYSDGLEMVSAVWGGVDLMALPEGWVRPGLLEDLEERLYAA